jgi:hypothetical protein
MPNKTTKFKAHYVYWDVVNRSVINPSFIEQFRVKGRVKLPDNIIRFDSQHEFKVYLELIRIYGVHRVVRQHPIRIITPGFCYGNGKTWKVDFAIRSENQLRKYDYYIEAKGAVLSEFKFALALLEEKSFPKFKKLVIVFPRSIPSDDKVIARLKNSCFRTNLLTFKELERLTSLSYPQLNPLMMSDLSL